MNVRNRHAATRPPGSRGHLGLHRRGQRDECGSLLALLDEKIGLIACQPLMGRARPELAPKLRSLAVGRYIVFYQPLPDGIEVIRVLHSARDIGAVFGVDDQPPLRTSGG